MATTHWAWVGELRREFPRVRFDTDRLFVDEGSIITGAGVAAGIDVCLHLVRLDHGAERANEVARAVVAAPTRSGEQAQFISRSPRPAMQERLAGLREWMLAHLDSSASVSDLARRAGLSERTLTRAFVAETGLPPLRWWTAARVDEAQRLLESTDLGLESIAHRCGLGTGMNLRARFRASVGVSPSAYRATFGTRRRAQRSA